MPLYNEEREGQSAKITPAGGGGRIIEWQNEPSAFSQNSQVLQTIMSTLEQEETKRRKQETEKFDMYKTLREAGYDTKSAYEAMQSGNVPKTPPTGDSLKEKKDKADLARTESQTKLDNEKAAAYARGDMGKRQSAAEKMNAAQLEREIKRYSPPPYGSNFDADEESRDYVSFLNQRLQKMSQYPGSGGTQPPVASTPGKIRVRLKSNGQTGTISEKFFDPNKHEKI